MKKIIILLFLVVSTFYSCSNKEINSKTESNIQDKTEDKQRTIKDNDDTVILKASFKEKNVDIEDLINSYKNSKIGKSLILALKGYNDTGRLLLFEKYIENFLTNLLKEKVQRMPYGPEIIFAYVHAKEVEIKNLRICLVGRANGLSADFIKERLRETYV